MDVGAWVSVWAAAYMKQFIIPHHITSEDVLFCIPVSVSGSLMKSMAAYDIF